MMETRCKKCNRLLFKHLTTEATISIKCPKCGYINECNLLNVERLKQKIENHFKDISKEQLEKELLSIVNNL